MNRRLREDLKNSNDVLVIKKYIESVQEFIETKISIITKELEEKGTTTTIVDEYNLTDIIINDIAKHFRDKGVKVGVFDGYDKTIVFIDKLDSMDKVEHLFDAYVCAYNEDMKLFYINELLDVYLVGVSDEEFITKISYNLE